MELDRLALERDAHVLVCPRCDNDYLHQTAATVELSAAAMRSTSARDFSSTHVRWLIR